MKQNGTMERRLLIRRLQKKIAQITAGQQEVHSLVPGLSLFQWNAPTEPVSGMYEPSICMVAQGAKRAILGDDTFVYDSDHYLITSVHLPTMFQVINASEKKPYLGLRLLLDPREMAQMMLDSNLPAPRNPPPGRGMATGEVTLPLLDAIWRMLNLLDDTQDIPILAPSIQREIIYRLMVGEQGARLRQIATAGSQSQQVARTIDWLKGNFAKPLRVEELAKQAHMSASAFHQHFRSMTALSPLQYQKNLRLREARRLMLTEDFDAAAAAFEVGYESPSQFSREYSRLFGQPPLRDITNLRQVTDLQV